MQEQITAERSREMRDIIESLSLEDQKTVQIALVEGATFEEAIALVEEMV
jgi:hypothetical protein